MNGLLQKNPANRLSLDELLAHPYLQSTDYNIEDDMSLSYVMNSNETTVMHSDNTANFEGIYLKKIQEFNRQQDKQDDLIVQNLMKSKNVQNLFGDELYYSAVAGDEDVADPRQQPEFELSDVIEEPTEESKVEESNFQDMIQMSAYNLATGKQRFITKHLTQPGYKVNGTTILAQSNYF